MFLADDFAVQKRGPRQFRGGGVDPHITKRTKELQQPKTVSVRTVQHCLTSWDFALPLLSHKAKRSSGV